MKNLNSLSKRLVYALEVTRTKKADLARAIDVKPQVIQFLCTSSTQSSRFTFEIAAALGLNTRWLATGEGEMLLANDPQHKLLEEYKRVPVLSHEQLTTRHKLSEIDLSQHTDWEAIKTEHLEVFSFQLPDIAMEPKIPVGTLLFFYQAIQYSLKDEDILIAYIPEFNALVVREYIIENGKPLLIPQNKAIFHKIPLKNNIKILGVTVEWRFKPK